MPSSMSPADLTPGFLVVHSNLAEQLRALIVGWTATYPLDVFEMETVLVQSNGIAQWLKLALAADPTATHQGGLGIAAGLSLQMPGRFIWQLYRWILPDAAIPEHSAFDKTRLRWRLYRLLPNLCLQPEFQVLAQYLAQDQQQQKRDQLALKLADLFDQYQVYRADWLQDWQQHKDQLRDSLGQVVALPEAQQWQPLLWRAILADMSPEQASFSRAKLHQQFLAAAANYSPQQRPAGLPRRVMLFGISSLPQQSLEALAAIAPYTQILLTVHNPCQYFWADIVADKDLLRIPKQRQSYKAGMFADQPAAQIQQQAQPLLAAWGKQGRDYIRLLDQFDQTEQQKQLFAQERIDLFSPAEQHTLLGQLQNDILELNALPQTKQCWPVLSDAAAETICFATAHSALREVEALHDDLLSQFKMNPDLQFSDLMVMVPDINDYAAAIHAVFGRLQKDDARYIPFTISDQGALQQQPLLQALSWLMSIRQQRFGLSEILDLLQVPALAQRFAISPEQFSQLKNYLEQAGVRWGLDVAQRQSLDLPEDYQQHSLAAGLERMLAGYALGDAAPWQGTAPLAEVAGLAAAVVGQLALLQARLAAFWQTAALELSPQEWQQQLLHLLEQFFLGQSETDLQLLLELKQELQSWLECCQQAELNDPLPLAVVSAAWLQSFSEASLQQRFLAGAVNFATLMPMRAIPFAQIHLLGMHDGAFPRASRRQDFDLMAQAYRPGDRARRDDDRYLFLEAILSARKRLRISWIGQSIHDNSAREPSVLVAQLRDHLAQGWTLASGADLLAALTTAHPLQAFSPLYLDASSGLQSYQHEWRAMHQAGVDPRSSLSGSQRSGQPITTSSNETGANALTNSAAPLTGSATQPEQPQLPQLTLEDLLAVGSWDLAKFNELLRDPVRFFFRYRLNIQLDLLEQQQPDHEDFALNGLAHWQLQQRLSQALWQAIRQGTAWQPVLQQQLALFQLEGGLAQGAAGLLQQQQLQQDIEAGAAKLALLFSQSQPAENALLRCQYQHEGLLLADWFKDLRLDAQQQLQQIHWQQRAIKPQQQWQLKALLGPWLAAQLSSASGEQIQQIIIGTDGVLSIAPPTAELAQTRLQQLFSLLQQAYNHPLPLEINTAAIWLQGSAANIASEKLLAKMQTLYDGTDFGGGVIRFNPYLKRAYADFQCLWQGAAAAELPALFYQGLLDDLVQADWREGL